MRYSAVAALCAAPMALAGSVMDADLMARDSITIAEISSNSDISSITTTEVAEVILIWVNPGNNEATTTVNSVAAATAATAAATHTVMVGGTEKVYTPDTINAAVGDVVLFTFLQENHTVTQSQFSSPCVKNGTFDTGFMPNLKGALNPPPTAAMVVNVTTPTWFYCKQKTPKSHCGLGMTFSINPTAAKTQADFEALAIQQDGTGTSDSFTGTASTGSSSASSSSVAVAAAPAASSSSESGSALTTGQGTLDSTGACTCAVVCAAGSIPIPSAQGIGALGGMGGSIPAANLAAPAS